MTLTLGELPPPPRGPAEVLLDFISDRRYTINKYFNTLIGNFYLETPFGENSMAYKSMVKKEKIITTIRTSNERIEGAVFTLPNTRLLDLLNNQSHQFIPVSEAKVFSEDTGKLLYEVDFMAVNTNHILTMTEVGSLDAEDM